MGMWVASSWELFQAKLLWPFLNETLCGICFHFSWGSSWKKNDWIIQRYMFNLRNRQTAFHMIVLLHPQQCRKVPVFLCPHQHVGSYTMEAWFQRLIGIEFVNPTKWPYLIIKADGLQFGLWTLRDAELGPPQTLIQRAVCRMLGKGRHERSVLGPAWACVRLDQVWSLVFGNETGALEEFWEKGGKNH